MEQTIDKNLQQASMEWLRPQLDKDYEGYGERKMMELTRFDGYAMLDAIEFGAQWQKEHVWHRASEDPDETSLVLLALKDGSFIVADEKTAYIRSLVDKWCYIGDLLPKSE